MSSPTASINFRQTKEYANYIQSLGWKVEKIPGSNVFVKKIPIIGFSVAKIHRPQKINLPEIDKIAKRNKSLLVKIESEKVLDKKILKHGFKKDSWDILYTKSQILNTKNLSFENLPKDTRYEIRKSEKNGLKTEIFSGEDKIFLEKAKEFAKLWADFAKSKKIPALVEENFNLAREFGKNCLIFLTYSPKNSQPVAGALVIKNKKHANYISAFLTSEGKNLGASYFNLWQIIKFLNKENIASLDLEGLFDERFPKQRNNWQGFSAFKLSWGGETIYYPGSFVKYYSLPIKIIFTLFSRLP